MVLKTIVTFEVIYHVIVLESGNSILVIILKNL